MRRSAARYARALRGDAVSNHRVASGLLIALCALLLAVAAVTGYADRVLFDADRFAARTATALQDPDVRTVVAERVTDQLVLRNRPDLLTARPLIAGAVGGLVAATPSPASCARRRATPTAPCSTATRTRSR